MTTVRCRARLPPIEQLSAAAQSEPGTSGIDLVSHVTTKERYTLGEGQRLVVAYDLGIKKSIVEQLAEIAMAGLPLHTPLVPRFSP